MRAKLGHQVHMHLLPPAYCTLPSPSCCVSHYAPLPPGVYHQYQVLACLGVGADYMAPYLGRMADKSSEVGLGTAL
jgi:hypothetical protein